MTSSRLRDTPWKHRYTSSTDTLVDDFYGPALRASSTYDRASGYFRSTVFLLAGAAVAEFALRGGRARIICSPNLSPGDIEAIKAGVTAAEAAEAAVLREMTATLEDRDARAPLEVLAALIGLESLELRFALRDDGMFHDKLGIFTDAFGDCLSFAGSINETLSGWSRNHESFEVFTSWTQDSQRVREHVDFFDRAWDGEAEGVEVFTAPAAIVDRILEEGPTDPERYLESRAASDDDGERRKRRDDDRGHERPTLFPHQEAGVRSWVRAGNKGILKHATGSGKTITGLSIAEDWLSNGGSVLVLVPSRLLLDQWESEISLRMPGTNPSVLLAGGRHQRWRKGRLVESFTSGRQTKCITVATMQTAVTPAFFNSVSGGEHLLVLADEVHRVGSPQNQTLMAVDAGARLGLSATPERYGDPVGTEAILEYFGPILSPEFGIADAIDSGRLTPYEYMVHVVLMDNEEADEWDGFTKEIGRIVARYKGKIPSPLPTELQFLLINRARIAKNASSKPPKAAEIVSEGYLEGQHWLVYCDNQGQVAQVRSLLKGNGIASFEYHAKMKGDRDETIRRFERNGGVMVAIRCLDEGVDIPAISHAVILASSQNPREFIQRRGRVLRKAPGKHKAVIHDLLVKPPSPDTGDALATAELARALEFAQHALNLGAGAELERLCVEWDVDPAELRSEGIERDEMDSDQTPAERDD